MGEVARVVVVGGEDGLAARVVRRLRVSGRDVGVVVSSPEDAAMVATGGARPLLAPTDDPAALAAILAGADAVVRLTPATPGRRDSARADAWRDLNRWHTAVAGAVADACVVAGVGVHVIESTTDVYSDGGGDEWGDDGPVDGGGSAVLQAVLAGERCAARVALAGGRGVVVRMGHVYGHDMPESIELVSLLTRHRYTMVGAGRQYRPAVHADDAAAAVEAALDAPSGTYSVTDSTPRQLREQLAAIATALDAPPLRRLPGLMGRVMRGEAWVWENRSQRISSARLHDVTGWAPVVGDSAAGWPEVVMRLRTGTAR